MEDEAFLSARFAQRLFTIDIHSVRRGHIAAAFGPSTHSLGRGVAHGKGTALIDNRDSGTILIVGDLRQVGAGVGAAWGFWCLGK